MFRIATLADLHWNAVSPEKMYHQLQDIFLTYIKKHPVNMVVIAGDYYDSIISLNSKSAKLSMLFMTNLMNVAKETGVQWIRIIKGTSSHDNNQLENLKVFENDDQIDFKIYSSVTDEEIHGYRILFLPEEYMKDIEEFYADYLEKTYDIIFGHGMFKETSFVASKQESAVTLSKAPVFNSDRMISICNGPILFGHIHTKCTIKKNIQYIGSFSRWVYGEEEPKGFFITEFGDDHTWKNTFVENTEAERYDTVVVTNVNKYSSVPEAFFQEMETLRKDYLRISFVLDNSEDQTYMLNLIREYYAKNPNYKLKITDKTIALRDAKQEKRMDELLEKYGFIFDTNLSHAEKIHRFIQVRDKQDISTEEIRQILSLS